MTINWLRDWDETIKQARATRKPILIDVYQED